MKLVATNIPLRNCCDVIKSFPIVLKISALPNALNYHPCRKNSSKLLAVGEQIIKITECIFFCLIDTESSTGDVKKEKKRFYVKGISLLLLKVIFI